MASNKTKTTSVVSRLTALKDKFAFDTVRQPDNLKSMRTRIVVRTILVEFLFSIMAFSLQGAKMAAEHNYIVLAVVLLALNFAERVVETAYNTYAEFQEDSFNEIYTKISTERIMSIAALDRGKVYKIAPNGIETVMPQPELIGKSKTYIDSVWHFWWTLPMAISRIITLAVMIGMTLAMESVSGSVFETSVLMSLLLICTVIYFIYGKKRINVMKLFRRQKNENKAREEVLFSELQTIEFASTRDFEYHGNRLRDHLINSKEVMKTENFKMNSVFIKRSAVASIFMIVILVFKVYIAGGLSTSTFISIVAISSVYSTILNNISKIISSIENVWDFLINIDDIYAYYKEIDEVYKKEIQKNKMRADIVQQKYVETCKIHVGEFVFSYDASNTWHLVNPDPFELLLGEVVLVQGETGCGKTTSLNVLNGNVRMPDSPIRFSNGQMGYLNTLTYHTDRSMADNYILNEIILSDDFSELDKDKLFEILDGLALKDLFLRYAKNDKALAGIESDNDLILGFMKIRTYKQFSSGQQQRIALAKLLYTLDKSVQAIWLDEAFNRLNDEIADHCVRFILDYVQRDRKRLVLIATHQVSVIRGYCSKEISFDVSKDGTSSIKFEQI